MIPVHPKANEKALFMLALYLAVNSGQKNWLSIDTTKPGYPVIKGLMGCDKTNFLEALAAISTDQQSFVIAGEIYRKLLEKLEDFSKIQVNVSVDADPDNMMTAYIQFAEVVQRFHELTAGIAKGTLAGPYQDKVSEPYDPDEGCDLNIIEGVTL